MIANEEKMGYSHYWTIHYGKKDLNLATFRELGFHVERIIEISTYPVANWRGEGMPEILNDYICLNGYGRDSFETLRLDRLYPGNLDLTGSGSIDDSCKTGRMPYDEIVTALLLICKHLFRDQIELTSDGTPDDWDSGYALAQQVIEDVIEPRDALKGEVSP